VDVFGCSADTAEDLERFRDELGVHFPMVSDEGGAAAQQLGIRAESGHPKRTTYFVDGDGMLRRVWYDVKLDGHVAEVAGAVGAPA